MSTPKIIANCNQCGEKYIFGILEEQICDGCKTGVSNSEKELSTTTLDKFFKETFGEGNLND